MPKLRSPLASPSVLAAISLIGLLVAGVSGQGQSPPTFRASVDLIAVDLEVVDRDGRPLTGLTPDKFTVTIDGRRHRVVTADMIRYGASAAAATQTSGLSMGTDASGEIKVAAPTGRVIVIAVDCFSFSVSASRDIIAAAREFVHRLLPEDRVGLFVFPMGARIDPTTDHTMVSLALDKVVGQRETPAANRFNLRPSELIDLSLWAGNSGVLATPPLVNQLCGTPVEEQCAGQLRNEIVSQALYYEGQAHAGLGMFRSLLEKLGTVPSRTMVVLLSAGTVTSDIPGGRPDLGDFGNMIGKAATRSNLTVYSLFVDQGRAEQNAAETRQARNTQEHLNRDSQILGRWIDQFTGNAGGAMLTVLSGRGDYAFDRVLSETAAYYLLGVEPAADDRDGRIHDLVVKVADRTATVRGRKWVLVPKPGTAAPRPPPPDPAAAAAPVPSVATETLPPRPPSLALAPLVTAFERGDDAAVHDLVVRAYDAGVLIRDFRTNGGYWPASPRKDAIFALELGVAGLRSQAKSSRDEAARLLVQYGALVRQPDRADAFECSWYLAEAAILPSLFQADATLPIVQQARQRCPAVPRLALTAAIIAEQQYGLQTTPALPGDRPAPVDSAREREIEPMYMAAAADPGTASEALTRAAWMFYRLNRFDRAHELLDRIGRPPADPVTRYLVEIVRGQVLRAQGDTSGAIAAFRAALAAFPKTTVARVSLMQLLLATEGREEAESLATEVQRGLGAFDPWWGYWLGDLNEYPARVSALRELAK